MALSMDEQRILSEIASQLGENDPRLAERLSTFGRARRRRRITLIVAFVVIVAVVATVVTSVVVIAAA
jgi:t-SNARE complex subunit (syntaxin)